MASILDVPKDGEGGKAETVKSLSPLSDWIQLNSVLERENYGREIALLQSAQN